jgi:hypothetical protein
MDRDGTRRSRTDLWRWHLPFGVMVLWQATYLLIGQDSDSWIWKALSVYAYTLLAAFGFLTARGSWRHRHDPRPSKEVPDRREPVSVHRRTHLDAEGNVTGHDWVDNQGNIISRE